MEKHTIAIPYFGGHPRQMPYVLLRSQSTGVEAWFVNVHNPADTRQHRRQQAFRTRATQLEVALVNRLLTTGRPVFLTGDMNERAPYFCRLTAGAAHGRRPRGQEHRRALRPGTTPAVDWIFGSRGVEFTGYDEDRSPLVDITTDHPVVTAQRPPGRRRPAYRRQLSRLTLRPASGPTVDRPAGRLTTMSTGRRRCWAPRACTPASRPPSRCSSTRPWRGSSRTLGAGARRSTRAASPRWWGWCTPWWWSSASAPWSTTRTQSPAG